MFAKLTLSTALLSLVHMSNAQKTDDYHLLVGTYTQKESEGIYVYHFNTKTGEFSRESVAKGLKNPSFLAISPDQKKVYSVGEMDNGGAVYAFSFDNASGKLEKLSTESSGGAGPCHIAVDKTGKWVMVGNYGGGSLSILPVLPTGGVGAPLKTIQHEGSGPNKQRQEKAHVHSINIADNNLDVYVPDLGIDEVTHYQLDSKNGTLKEAKPTRTSPGAGPRHFTFHPSQKFAYVINELDMTVTAYNYNKDGSLSDIQTISTVPADFKGTNICADIHISPDGKFLYGSNRGHDSIVCYSIDSSTGKLTLVEITPSGGKHPRNFAIDPSGRLVLVANRDTDNIVIFNRNAQTGKLTPTGKEISLSMPVCLKLIPKK
ncbi:6-phosphogluconolactonase [Siphonobacter sp. SORGH_AS 1065]|nr:6-phosphogluconolactonase [Siphonobacter sp. SORGH_AS_1065]